MTMHGPKSRSDDELWIDGCGGYRLAVADHWHLGGPDYAGSESPAGMIRIAADLPRVAGTLRRSDGEFVWQAAVENSSPVLLGADQAMPNVGSAQLFVRKPSPLSASGVLRLLSPHRFAGHVDGVVLVADSVLIGPGRECHIVCPEMTERVVLTAGTPHSAARVPGPTTQWSRVSMGQEPIEVIPNQRFHIGEVSMTLVRS